MSHVKWPSIESLKNVKKTAEYFGSPTVQYRAKVKLHGTNAGIRVKGDGQLIAQSRSRDVTPGGGDNAGFAKWIEDNTEQLQAMLPRDCVIFGEWIGPGIMKGTSASCISSRAFAVFGIIYDERIIYDPKEIAKQIKPVENYKFDLSESTSVELDNGPLLHVLPWYGDIVTIDLRTPNDAREAITQMVEDVELCDPWVKSVFNVEGTGEGLVFYPLGKKYSDRDTLSTYIFKAKGDKHKVKSTKQKVEIDPEVLATVEEFVDAFVTLQRLEQCLSEVGAQDRAQARTGKVIKWMSQDVLKESVQEA